MAAFTRLNPQGSRFSDGSHGVFYCTKKRETAIAETRYHQTQFMMATRAEPRIVDPDSYGYSQGIGRALHDEGANGILYPSVRHTGGECLAAFKTTLLKNCLHAAYLEYNWNGREIDAVFEVSQVG